MSRSNVSDAIFAALCVCGGPSRSAVWQMTQIGELKTALTAKAIVLMLGWIAKVTGSTADLTAGEIESTGGWTIGVIALTLGWIVKVKGSIGGLIEKATVSKRDMIERRSEHGKTVTKSWQTDWNVRATALI